MAIKSDRWIREMSEKHGMIEPYAENQIRLDENGQKLISYGVSSYGYDVRCAREFKVFTNVHSAIVDPKTLTKKALSILNRMFVSFHPTHLLWRVQ